MFSSDRLPTKPRLLVCNTDPSGKSDEQCIVIIVDDDRHYGEHWDSLGRAPTCTFKRYMNEHCREWIYNYKQLHTIVSQFSGHYCVAVRAFVLLEVKVSIHVALCAILLAVLGLTM